MAQKMQNLISLIESRDELNQDIQVMREDIAERCACATCKVTLQEAEQMLAEMDRQIASFSNIRTI